MANLKSSKKDIRRISRRTERNGAAASSLKTLRKKVVEDPSAENKSKYASALDKAAKSGAVHPNKVSREKAKMATKELHSKNRH